MPSPTQPAMLMTDATRLTAQWTKYGGSRVGLQHFYVPPSTESEIGLVSLLGNYRELSTLIPLHFETRRFEPNPDWGDGLLGNLSHLSQVGPVEALVRVANSRSLNC
jgi:hypothetical protein